MKADKKTEILKEELEIARGDIELLEYEIRILIKKIREVDHENEVLKKKLARYEDEFVEIGEGRFVRKPF